MFALKLFRCWIAKQIYENLGAIREVRLEAALLKCIHKCLAGRIGGLENKIEKKFCRHQEKWVLWNTAVKLRSPAFNPGLSDQIPCVDASSFVPRLDLEHTLLMWGVIMPPLKVHQALKEKY